MKWNCGKELLFEMLVMWKGNVFYGFFFGMFVMWIW